MVSVHSIRSWICISKVFPYLGDILKFNALFLLFPVPVALHYHEPFFLFVAASLASFASGWLIGSGQKKELALGEAMLLTITTLILVSAFSSIVYVGVLTDEPAVRIVNSFFESVSGYTTTGLSVIAPSQIESYPKSVLFLRAVSQWIGGVGIIVMFMLIASYRDFNIPIIYKSERGDQKVHPSSYSNAKELFKIYCFYSLAGVMLLFISGMDWYSSLYNTMASISTGGFWYNNSKVYVNLFSEGITIAMMLLGSMGFFLHYTLINGRLGDVLRNIEVKAMAIVILIGIILFTNILYTDVLFGLENFGETLDESVFNVVSAATTTGYSTIDFAKITDFGKLTTTLLMIIGAGVNSTGGGIKLMRFVIIIYSVMWMIKKTILPQKAIVPFRIHETIVEDYESEHAFIQVAAHIIILIVGALLLTAYGYDAADSLFVSSSAIGTVGLSTLPIHELALTLKLYLTLEMLIGRVETLPVLVLMTYAINYARGILKQG